MAARNVKSVPGFEASDKMQSSTLKRQPSPDWSKNDLLRLLSYFEGELQARDITIAALKAEKAKQLLYQAKYGRFGLGDPFVALQRDTIGTRDSNFDEAAVKSMYDNQLAQLENLIATQRKAQLKMREQLANAEKRYHKVCSELEEEKRKHAQDTAQGDDVTYMLEKERERLRQEIDFEKSTSKKLEKDLRRTLAALEEERASAARHKQVALLLLKERKHILQKLATGGQALSQGDSSLPEEMRAEDMVEGLQVDPQRSLTLEAALEEQLGKIEAERAAFPASLEPEANQSRQDLESQVEALQRQVQSMAAGSGAESVDSKSSAPLQSGQVSPNASGGVYGQLGGTGAEPSAAGRPVAVIGSNATSPQGRQAAGVNRVVDGGRIGSISPDREVIHRPLDAPLRKMQYGVGGGGGGGYSSPVVEKQGVSVVSSGSREARVVTVGSSGPESSPVLVAGGGGGGSVGGGGGARVNISPGNSATVVTQGGGKIFHVSAGSGGIIVGGSGTGSPHRTAAGGPLSAGRGHPPPVPPNKPNIPPGATAGKPAPPPKVAVMGRASGAMEGKVVQIPVNVVASPTSASSPSPSSSSQSSRESSPIRKTAQPPPPHVDTTAPVDVPSNPGPAPSTSATLEFLGPEMASLQELLAALTTGEAGTRDPSSLVEPPSPSPTSPSPSLPTSLPPPPFPSSLITPSSIDVQNSAVHKMAASGDLGALRMLILHHDADVNLPLKDGTTPLHCAVENDRDACLQLLLDKGGQASALRDDRVTPVHIAAALGHSRCLKVLLERGAAVNIVNEAGDTALHLTVDRGHLLCCQLLLLHGANVTLPRADGLTAVHYAVWREQPDILRCLLERLPPGDSPPPCLLAPFTPSPSPSMPTSPTPSPASSLVHLAAQLPSETCLRLLTERLPLKLTDDGVSPSVLAVASPACKAFLSHIGEPCGADLNVMVELKTQLEGATVSVTRIGTMQLSPSSSWAQLEEQLRGVLSLFLTHLDQGLRTRRLLRLESEGGGRESHFSLGIGMAHVSMFEMGFYRWAPGVQTEKLPYNMASNNAEKKVAIIIDDTDNFCELIAFDILHPLSVLQDYLRLLDQYKSVVFHGPVNSGKSYLVQRLAQCLAVKQKGKGEKPAIFQLKLSSKTSHDDLITFLQQKGCLLAEGEVSNVTPILILDNLEKVNMADLFGPLLDPLGHRGKQHAFGIKEHVRGDGQRFYFPDNFCILATLNRSRSTGIELHVQQRFRWVHFRHDAEPLRNLLARHFLRRLYHLGNGRLPGTDDPLLRATEWIICIWQRLNDSLGKLGLPDLVFGPCCFFRCPLEKKAPQLILQWVQELWNSVIAPQVREAVKRSTGSDTVSGGQEKVANTALYVLMQRSVVLSCPLPIKEKEAYLQGFSGSNELDLPFKAERRDGVKGATPLSGRQVKTAHRSDSDKGGDSIAVSSAGGAPGGASAASGRSQGRHGSGSGHSRTPSRHREERGRSMELFSGSNIKRRSLSESSMNKTARYLHQLQQQEEGQGHPQSRGQGSASATSVSHQAKVPKLEVRSSRILSLSNSFKSSPSPGFGEVKSSRVGGGGGASSHYAHHHQYKKSRSSENISPSGLYSSSKSPLSPNPFSFSLSTPKSSLVSFKFFDKSSASSEMSVLSSMTDSGGDVDVGADLSSAQTPLPRVEGAAAINMAASVGQEASGSV